MANFLDTFTGAAGGLEGHAADTGQSWSSTTPLSPNAIALDGAGLAYGAVASGLEYLPAYTAPSADTRTRLRVRVGTSTGSAEVGVLARSSGTGGAVKTYLGRVVSGTGAQIFTVDWAVGQVQLGSTAAGVTLADGDVLEMTAVGSSPVVLTLFKNGTQVATASDSGNFLTAAGFPGLHVYNPGGLATTNYRADALWAGALAGPTLSCTAGSTALNVGGATTTATTTGFSGGATFTSSNTGVATVNSSTGVVTPVGTGTCTVTATGTVFAQETATSATITVSAAVAALSVSPSSVTISSTGTLTLTDPAGHWTTTAPTFTPTGVAGFTLGTVTVVSDTTATAPYTAGATAGTVTIAESGAGVSATLAVSSNAFYLTGVPPGFFAAGLTTAGYSVSLNGGSYGSLITVGIVEDIPGAYSATFTATPGSVAKVKWTDGAALQAVDFSPQGSPSPVVGGKVAVRLNASDVTGNVPASLNAITGTAISSGIYTMRAVSTSSLVHFDATDAIANGLSGAVSRQIEILGGTGVPKGFVGITSVSGSSGSKDGVPNADASGFDATTTYQWAGPIPTKPGDAMGLAPTAFDAITVETGYSAKAALKVALGAIGGAITGNGTALITAGALPTPTTGSNTVITATMGGTGRTDRTATGIVLSST